MRKVTEVSQYLPRNPIHMRTRPHTPAHTYLRVRARAHTTRCPSQSGTHLPPTATHHSHRQLPVSLQNTPAKVRATPSSRHRTHPSRSRGSRHLLGLSTCRCARRAATMTSHSRCVDPSLCALRKSLCVCVCVKTHAHARTHTHAHAHAHAHTHAHAHAHTHTHTHTHE